MADSYVDARTGLEVVPVALFGRFDRPARGCHADRYRLGWVPGRRYVIWTGRVDLILGYDTNGAVIVRGEDGVERTHRTTVHRTDRIVVEPITARVA